MSKLTLSNLAIKYPGWIIGVTVLVTLGFALQFPKVSFDNDPENMLSPKEHVRLFHNQVKEKFNLYDFVIVGIENETHEFGIFNVETLGKIDDLTQQLISLRQNEEGRPEVVTPARGDRPETVVVPDLQPDSLFKRILAKAFKHDAENLFKEDGSSAIIGPEIISPSVVDNIRQAELGQLAIEYLMEEPPKTQQEALAIRDAAMSNPLYRGTLVSEDGKAICLYIPIAAKTFSYNVANLIRTLTEGWEGEEQIFITGQPVAQDTFGVEMLVQMATSAPMAGLMIFLLLLVFFRRISLIVAPMILAVVSVVCTMGLLIGLGFDVHIMSSMIAIFLMPIAVADSVHVLSEFFDTYHRFKDKVKTLRHVISHLFMPMLYTTLTTMAGFGSLGLTPIPPVRIFGLHVAFGVGLAWLLTMIFIPAYILVAVPQRTLDKLAAKQTSNKAKGLDPFLEWLGRFSFGHWRMILVATLLVIVVSAVGISRIRVNDNPIKWFTADHEIRVADHVLNSHFGGTYTAYLTLEAPTVDRFSCEEKAAELRKAAERRFAKVLPKGLEAFNKLLDKQQQLHQNLNSADLQACFVQLVNEAESIDEEITRSWFDLADTVNYLDPEGLTFEKLTKAISDSPQAKKEDKDQLLAEIQSLSSLNGAELQEEVLSVCDRFTDLSFKEFVFEMEAELTAPLFKQPDVLAYVQKLEDALRAHPLVGKTSSAIDALKKANYELNFTAAPADASPQEREAFQRRNQSHYSIPDSAAAVAQVFTQLEGMKKKDSLFHLVTKDYQELNLWVQLKSGDNRDMLSVAHAVDNFFAGNPSPHDLTHDWAGLTYLNVVWQDKMVAGMLSSLASSFVVVLIMMMLLFRSPLFGALSMIPLSVTISFIYGLIGLVGKDYDMPVAVLSALTLGLSVDFAIHFLERARELRRARGSWQVAITEMFKEPAMAISRNAIVISIGFTPLLFAPLVPYKTVGFFLATIMAVSWMATLFILAAMVTMLQGVLFKEKNNEQKKTQ